MGKINTVVFDMDGTVLDTLEDLTASMNYVMELYSFPARPKNAYRAAFGNGIRQAMRLTVPEGTREDVLDRMILDFRKRYDAHCLDNTRPYEGIIPMMRILKEKGFKMAIVSNKIDSAVKELGERFFSDTIDVAIGEKKGVKRKPAPDTVFEALRILQRSADEAIYVGDSEVDLETARNAGLPCVSCLWGFRDIEFLEKNDAKIFVKSPEELGDIILSGSF